MIERPRIIKPIVERPNFIRPIIERVIIEKPEFVRPMRERPMIETTKIVKPLFDWCGDLVVPLDPEATAPRVGRSLKELLNTGRYTPGSRLKQSYLAAVRAQPKEETTAETPAAGSAGSCCGDAPAVRKVVASAIPKPTLPQYRDQPPRRFPLARRDVARSLPQAKPAAAVTAPVAAIGAATMVVPRGSR